MDRLNQDTILLCNRSGKDRRVKNGFNLRSLFYGGKRAKIRRQQDTNRIFYVDQFSPELFAIITSIIILCVLDALFTFWLLNRGAYEVNPILKWFLQIGPYTFFFFKYLLTCGSLICLLMFRNIVIRGIKISTCSLLYFIIVFYVAVVVWELHLISSLPNAPDLKSPPRKFFDTQIICQVDDNNYYPSSKESILFGMRENNAELNKPVCLKNIPQSPRDLDYISKTKTIRYAESNYS